MEHTIVSHAEWEEARRQHLAEEKKFTRLRDRLSQARRDPPWQDVFEGREQLVTYHAMFNPNTASERTTWTKDSPCFACSFWMDNFDRVVRHLNHRDITMAAVSRAPIDTIESYRKRMGWTFPWYSSTGSDFNFDFHVSFTPDQLAEGSAEYNYRIESAFMSERPGLSVFAREDGKIFHTYSAYARGLDMVNVAITTWISSRTAATSRLSVPWGGCAATTSTPTEMVMAVMMAAMMGPTAAPFFFAYGRDTRRPASVAFTIAIYIAVWGVIGALADIVMSQVMMPSSILVGVVAVAFAALYTLSPWSRRARGRCRQMCIRTPRGLSPRAAIADGVTYTARCLICSAGVMVALVF